MKYVYSLVYSAGDELVPLHYRFVSSTSFEMAVKLAIAGVHRQHPSKKISFRNFSCVEGDTIPDEEPEYER